jgi:transposase
LERVVGTKLARSAVTALLAKYPTPKALRAAGKSRVHRFLKSRTPRGVDQLVASIWAALDAQTVVVPAQGTLGRVIAELATELGRIRRRRIDLGKEIEELFLAHPLGPVLGSLPGIGPRTGARILAEIGDGSGFETGAKLAAYAGLAPVTRSSGTSIKGQRRSRRGNHRLKNAMFLAAFASLRSGASKTYYDRKRSEGKKHNAAVVCLARRRCDVILAMLRTQETYRTPDQIQARKAA